MSALPVGALDGVRVVDLTHFLAGPYCTQMLADQGADVIKIEPIDGDSTRGFGPFHPEDKLRAFAGYFASVNRNKRSVSLNLKSPEAREALRTLVDGADVVVENYRAGVMERFGLSYEALKARNPKLVYATIRGFGDARTRESPYADWPAYDVVAQAFGGIMAITGEEGGAPTKIGPGIGDIAPAMFCAFGIVCAVHRAARTGQGQFVDVSMVDSILAMCERVVHQHAFGNLIPVPQGNHHPFLCPFGTYPTKDGFCTITAYDDSMFRILCEIMSQPELARDSRFLTYQDRWDHREALIAIISAFTSVRTKAELLAVFGGQIPFGPVYNVEEIVSDPHFRAREMVVPVEQPGLDAPVLLAGVPVKMSETPGAIRRRAPLLGEHTAEVLAEIGCSVDDIHAWHRVGAIRLAEAKAAVP
ncbi:MAG TPA: CoA transferase [Bradyrhizobium sp.]|nr:CoA transferase [Bradyrhizobium sp.]